MEKISVSEITPALLPKVKDLLKENHLPYNDIHPDKVFLLGTFNEKSELTGVAGVEKTGKNGLFRSLAVREEYRSKGTGKMLHDEIITHSIVFGIHRLYLLTTTAEKYFEKAGWKKTGRNDVPEEVSNTEEFSSICPSSAVCMQMDLPVEKPEVACAVFHSGFNCAQAVFIPFAAASNADPMQSLKLATGFGAGMVYRGETCGAITGAMMAIGLNLGRKMASDTGSRDITYMVINRLYDEFKKLHGSILCKELLNVDVSTEEGRMNAGKAGLFHTVCPKLVSDSAAITERLLKEYSK